MCASSVATRCAISRTTVIIVPSAGSRTDAYAASAARAIAADTSTGSTSSPGPARQLLGRAAHDLREDHPAVAARAEQRRARDRLRLSRRGRSRPPSGRSRRSSSAITARSVWTMLSPVSPSATGNTLRSLTSWRRASSCAQAEATTLRKRSMEGSGTEVSRGSLGGLGHLPRFEAAGADVHAPRRAAVIDPDLLKIGVEAPLGRDHRVAAAVPEGRALAARMTNLGHSGGILEG